MTLPRLPGRGPLGWDPVSGWELTIPPRLRLPALTPDDEDGGLDGVVISAYVLWIKQIREGDDVYAQRQVSVAPHYTPCELCQRPVWTDYWGAHKVSAGHVAAGFGVNRQKFARYLKKSLRVHRAMAALEGVRLLPRRHGRKHGTV